MKGLLALLMVGIVSLGLASVQQQDKTPRIDKREVRQQKRIEQGVKSGQLTPKEAKRLEKQQAKIKRNETKAKANGNVTPKERAKLTRQQNKASKNIYAKKHNQKKVEQK